MAGQADGVKWLLLLSNLIPSALCAAHEGAEGLTLELSGSWPSEKLALRRY